MEPLTGKHWHHLSIDESVRLLETDLSRGLSPDEVQRRLEQYGPNAVPAQEGPGVLIRFLLQFHQPLIYILLAATMVTLVLQEYLEAGVIFGVVLINAVIGFIQETRAVQALEALAKTMTTQATAVREGQKQQLPSEGLVPGDVVLVQSGDKVPADLRLVRVRDLQVDESALTGESLPVAKSTEPLPAETLLADRTNLAYSSSLVTYGQATGVVIATGLQTEVGRISEMIAGTAELETPLTRQITRFSHLLLYSILLFAAATVAIGTWRGEPWFDMFMAAVALAVAAIPEGLPAAITITLAIGVARMARRRAIIRKLPAVETLGSTTVICSDKTGTLTENQMTVQAIYAGGLAYHVSGAGYAPGGEINALDDQAESPETNLALYECLRAGLLCNDSRLEWHDGRWVVHGDPTEGALLVSAAKAGLTPDDLHAELPRVDAIPFESEHQYMATLHDHGPNHRRTVYVKGAVEAILNRCDQTLSSRGEDEALDRDTIHQVAADLASRGLRVLAFARDHRPADSERLEHDMVASGLVFLGLQGMIDPPRAEAITAVKQCHTAGIQVKMITGDHALTAAAIARQIGIARHPNGDRLPEAMSGRDLAMLSDEALPDVAEQVSVFARVTPEQKLRLVRALQGRGHVVAMTGDGVNDAPALKQADIGVAMGITGTEVAKDAADMVLTDDNFASIESAIEEGRGIFDNLTKFIVWTLPTNLGEGLVILAAILAATTLPILPLQILWINMTTAVLLGLMLAFEPKEPGIMTRAPRNPQQPILTKELIIRIFLVGGILLAAAFGFFELALVRGMSDAEARTVAVNVFVFVEMFYLFNSRSLTYSMFHVGLLSNFWIIVGVSTMILLQMLFTYSSVMNRLFNTAPIGWQQWGWVLAASLLTYLVIELEKFLRRRFSRSERHHGASPNREA